MEHQPFLDVASFVFDDRANGKLWMFNHQALFTRAATYPPPMQRRIRSALTAIRTGFLGPEG
jgi:hypothetical protein